MALRDPIRRKLTYEDYLLFPEDGNRHEILDGEHFVTAAPNLWHQSIIVELTSWIAPFVRRHRLGRLYVAPADVLLSEHDIVQPGGEVLTSPLFPGLEIPLTEIFS
jgi:Uma2 family endonuclease